MKKFHLLFALSAFAAKVAVAQTQPGLTPPPNPVTEPTSGAASGAGGAGTLSPGVQTDTAAQAASPASAAAGSASAGTAAVMGPSSVGVMISSGVTYLVRGDEKIRVDQTVEMTISPQGVITGFFGKPYTLQEGQLLTMNGRLSGVPVSLQVAPDAKDSASEKNAGSSGK